MDKITLPQPTRISENEYTFMNEHALEIIFKNKVFNVGPDQTCYFEDKLLYKLMVVENDHYEPNRYDVLVNKTLNCDDTDGRVIFNFKDELTKIRNEYLAKVEAAAEEIRGKYITLGAGQAMTYQQKLKEAEALLANLEINPYEIPHIVLEAVSDNVTPYEKAVEIVSTYHFWTQISALIDDKRLSSKKNIMAAGDLESLDKTLIDINWEL